MGNHKNETFVKYAQELGLKVDEFKSAPSSGQYDDRIDQDTDDAKMLGVTQVPTIFINEKKMTLPPTAENLRAEINQILNKD